MKSLVLPFLFLFPCEMENHPSAYIPPSSMAPPSPSLEGCIKHGTRVVKATKGQKMTLAEQLVLNLSNPELREKSLVELSKKRDMFQDLALLLWNSIGTIGKLLQEVTKIYYALSPPTLTPAASNKFCNILALFQCVASHPKTRTPFLDAKILHYIYPLLHTADKSRTFENLRLSSLGVIGALVKVEDTEFIESLLKSEVMPSFLQIMEIGSELSKTVATYIVQKVLLDDAGLRYFCATAECFYAVYHALAATVASLRDQPSVRLLKHIIRCYVRLCDDPRARVALQTYLPSMLRDGTFDECLRGEPCTQYCLKYLLATLGLGSPYLRPE